MNCCWSRIVAAGILTGIVTAVACGGGEPNAPSQEKRSGWEALNLVTTTISGTTVYHEKALEPNLPIFERELAKLVTERQKAASVSEKASMIIADIDRIIGPLDVNAIQREDILTWFGSAFSRAKLTLYLVRTTTIKEYLRGGGQLPDFTYDPKGGGALYRPRVGSGPGRKPPDALDLCLPITDNNDFDKGLKDGFKMLRMFTGSTTVGAAIHEVTEATLFIRAKPTDPYWRWFTDGFANAITIPLVEKYLGKESAEEFGANFNTDKHRDSENQINLRYWMMANYCPCDSEVPVKAEKEILDARYAYATFEARRLIDANGIGCVRKILDKIAARQSRTGKDLGAAVKEVTGEDMESRLDRYQTFKSREEAISKYSRPYEEAYRAKDYERMFVIAVRLMELSRDVGSLGYVECFKGIAELLLLMGHEDAGDMAMRQALDLYSKSSVESLRQAAMEAFIVYALECKHPDKAEKEADELLRMRPGHSLALANGMLIAFQHGNLPEAKSLAKQIVSRDSEQSMPYKMATQVLAIDPNRPGTYNRMP